MVNVCEEDAKVLCGLPGLGLHGVQVIVKSHFIQSLRERVEMRKRSGLESGDGARGRAQFGCLRGLRRKVRRVFSLISPGHLLFGEQGELHFVEQTPFEGHFEAFPGLFGERIEDAEDGFANQICPRIC